MENLNKITNKYINNYIKNKHVLEFVNKSAELCNPDKIYFCDGSEEEKKFLTDDAIKSSELIELNQEKFPGCVLHRTAINDVARTEHLTYICTTKKENAGPTNKWMAPEDAYKELSEYFRDSMKGRTMYVIPFMMGVPGSKMNKIGVELTDSIYVVLNMRIMTRIGKITADGIRDDKFTNCLHSKGDISLEKRRICHFPEDNTIWSINSGYGGNVLLGKKCLALRIASYLGKKEGWLAEHMLLMEIQTPDNKTFYVVGAFPSACGKTNLSMLIPPELLPGYKVRVLGDDIAWMYIGDDGRLWAINPEAGFFGVVPGTNMKTNKNAMLTIKNNTIFTNVLLKEDNTVWWEGMENPPDKGIDWKGDLWTKESKEPGTHPNSRFTVPTSQCPAISPEFLNPKGVPVSAILFGGRRENVVPLVYKSFNWQHGVFIGATLRSEGTAAAIGLEKVVRNDPMAMIPFCGYNMGDYFAHWLDMGKRMKFPPKIFFVNWFRKNKEGKFLWPGYGENLRVIEWIIKQCDISNNNKEKEAVETPVGYVPAADAINTKGIEISKEDIKELFGIDKEGWLEETDEVEKFFSKFDRMPKELTKELNDLRERLKKE